MFRLVRPAAQRRYVDGGRVHCPVRGRDIEVDLCAGCDRLSEIDLRAKPPFVRCRPDPGPASPTLMWR